MAKRRHEEEQVTSSKTTMAVMTLGGVAVAALVVWALTRTVQPAPTPTTTVPVTATEQPTATATAPAPSTAAFDTAAGTVAPPPQTPPPVVDETASVARMGVSELRSKIDTRQITVIDVRDKTSYIGSHIPGSLHVPAAQMESQASFLPKDKPIVLYCT